MVKRFSSARERLRPPELMHETATPARRHVGRIEYGAKQAEIAEPQLPLRQTGGLHGIDQRDDGLGFRLLAGRHRRMPRCRPDGTRAGARLSASRPAGSETPSRCSSTWLWSPDLVALHVQAAGRHGDVGAQTQLVAIGIGEHVGARAQRLADHVEEHVGRLDDGRRDGLVAGLYEGAHQPLRLGFQRFEFLRRLCDHDWFSASVKPGG